MFGYIYKTTNKVNGHFYIGKREYRLDEKSTHIYYGSGVELQKELTEFGESAFAKEILEECETNADMFVAEEKFIRKFETDANCLNNTLGIGYGGIYKDNYGECAQCGAIGLIYHDNLCMRCIVNKSIPKYFCNECQKITSHYPDGRCRKCVSRASHSKSYCNFCCCETTHMGNNCKEHYLTLRKNDETGLIEVWNNKHLLFKDVTIINRIKERNVGKSIVYEMPEHEVQVKSNGKLVWLKNVIINNKVSNWIKIVTKALRSDGFPQTMMVTTDHPFPVQSGEIKQAQDLSVADQLVNVNETIKHPIDILSIEQLDNVVANSYDVTTESGYFDLNGNILSHNCRSALAPVWEDIRYPADTKFHWQLIDNNNEQFKGAPGRNFNYNRGFGTYGSIPVGTGCDKVVINFHGNSGWIKSYDQERKEFIIQRPKVYGRFNMGVVSVNIPHAALTAVNQYKDEMKAFEANPKDLDSNPKVLEPNLKEIFFKVFDERLELCHEALLERWKSVQKIQAKNSPIMWMHGAICRLQSDAHVSDYVMSWPNPSTTSISLGYMGLAETSWAIIGKSNTSDEGRVFCKEILQHMNNKAAEWKAADTLGYSIYGTPIEQLTTSAAAALQRDFGLVEHITDKDYVVNSYHVDPREHIDAFKKLEIEGEYLALSSGGAVSYVETSDLTNNPEAIETLIKYMHDHIMYAEVNRKIGVCYECGYQGDVPLTKTSDGEFEFTCPNCGNTNSEKMNITARLCGYIGQVNANNTTKGRLDDIYNRVLHLE